MKLSTRGRYGMRAMYELAVNAPDGTTPIKDIARRQDIPEAYLEQLMAVLKRAGLVASVRGAQGGYRLAREPGAISVGDVLRALEDGLNFMDCLAAEDSCLRAGTCPTRIIYRKMRDGLNQIVDGITLQDMIDDYRRESAGGTNQ